MTIKERVVLHLADYVGYDDDLEVPHDLCQEGIAVALAVDRSQVTKALAELREMDFVIERLLHVDGSKRRRKAYCLTPPGFDYSRRLREHLLPKIIDFVDDEDRLLEMPIGEIWQFMKHRVPFQRIITEAQKGSVTFAVLLDVPEPVPEGPVMTEPPPAMTLAPAPAVTPAEQPTSPTVTEPALLGPVPVTKDEVKVDSKREEPVHLEPPATAPVPSLTPPQTVDLKKAETRGVTPKEKFHKELKRRVQEKEAAKKGKVQADKMDKEEMEAREEVEKEREVKRRQWEKEGKVQKVDKIVLPSVPTSPTAAQVPPGPPPDLLMMPDGAMPPAHVQGYYPQYFQFYGPPDQRLPVDIRAKMRPQGYLLTTSVVLLSLAAIFTLPMTEFNLPFCVISLALAITGGILFVVHWEAMRASGFETMDTVTRRGVMAMALGFALVGTLHLATLQGSHPDIKNAIYGLIVIASVAVPLYSLEKLDRGMRGGLAIALGTLIVLLFLGTSIITSGERLAANQVPTWIVVGIVLFVFGKELDEMPSLSTLRSAVPGTGIGILYMGVLVAIGPQKGMLVYTCIAAWMAFGAMLAALPLLPVKRRAILFDSLGLGGGICGGLCLLIIGVIMVVDGIHIGLIEIIIGFVVAIYGMMSLRGVPKTERDFHVAMLLFLVAIEMLTVLNVLDQLRSMTSLG